MKESSFEQDSHEMSKSMLNRKSYKRVSVEMKL
jgi:hypothetical protein